MTLEINHVPSWDGGDNACLPVVDHARFPCGDGDSSVAKSGSGKGPSASADNRLFFGDNLDILREYVPDESVDLVYLDPPFNSQAQYNLCLRERTI